VSIDLHIHSTASDGTLSPSQLLDLAQNLNLGAIAITDHDTIDGSKEALAYGIPPSIKFLTGIEMSATLPPSFSCPGSFHILGYALDIDDPVLNRSLSRLKASRKNRNPRILELLSKMGIELTLNEVRNLAGDSQLGRPHIAQLMVKKKALFHRSMKHLINIWEKVNRHMSIDFALIVKKQSRPY